MAASTSCASPPSGSWRLRLSSFSPAAHSHLPESWKVNPAAAGMAESGGDSRDSRTIQGASFAASPPISPRRASVTGRESITLAHDERAWCSGGGGAGEMGVQQVPAGGQLVGGSGQVPGCRMRIAAHLAARGRCRCKTWAERRNAIRASRAARVPPAGSFRRAWREFPRQRHVTQVAGQDGDQAVQFPDHAAPGCIGQFFLD